MNTKTLLESRTFWLAVVQAVSGVVVVFSTAYPAVGGLLFAKSLLDIFLRAVTTATIESVV